MENSIKILYTKKRLRRNLFLGLFWLTLGILSFIFVPGQFFKYAYTGLAFLYLGGFLFENHYQHLTIHNNVITLHKLKSKKIKLQEIKQVKNISGNIILESDTQKMKINSGLIEKESLAKLNSLLDKV